MIRFTVPIKLDSIANRRLHWRALHRIKHGQRAAVKLLLDGHQLPPLPAVVTFTRIGKRMLDDDNLAHAFKAVRDQVAEAFGVDDGDARYRWVYQQRIGKEYAVEIEISPLGDLG